MLYEKRLVMTSSNKGGTGKSTFARGLADKLRRDQTIKTFLSDADGAVGQLFQYYASREPDRKDGTRGDREKKQNGLTGVHFFDIREPNQRDDIFQGIDSGADRVVMDLPAGSLNTICDIDEELKFFSYASDKGYGITFVEVITPLIASTKSVAAMLQMFSSIEAAAFIVVRNAAFGPVLNEDWQIYDDSRARKTLLARGGLELVMPGMRMKSYSQIDLKSLRFMDAPYQLELTGHKRAAFAWLQQFEAELEKAEGFL